MPENKKARFPRESLPPLKFPEEGYFVRYRIISEDKNRFSHWSPKYFISGRPFSGITASLSVDQNSPNPEDWTFNIIWSPNQEDLIPYFDVYINWDNEYWEYVASSSSGFYASNVRIGASTLGVAIQVPTFPQERFDTATVFLTEFSL